MYGMPDMETFNRSDVIIGGCCTSYSDPSIGCTNCEWRGLLEQIIRGLRDDQSGTEPIYGYPLDRPLSDHIALDEVSDEVIDYMALVRHAMGIPAIEDYPPDTEDAAGLVKARRLDGEPVDLEERERKIEKVVAVRRLKAAKAAKKQRIRKERQATHP